MKKKILTVLVCAAVMLTTACDKSGISPTPTDSSNESSSTSSKESSSTSSEENSSKESESSPESSSAPSESTPESSSATSGGDTEGGFTHGTVTANSYNSEFLGIKADFAEGWITVTDDILAQNNGITDMSDENVNKALNTNAILYELIAGTETNTNMNIVIENLNVTNKGKQLTGAEYIELAFPNVEAQFKAAGFESVEAEKSTVSFLGSEMACINTKLTNEGQEAVQKMIPLSNGTYMGIVTFTGANEEEIISTMSMFQKI